MANRTVKDAHTVKGTNPQYLVEKIIRYLIYYTLELFLLKQFLDRVHHSTLIYRLV